jgi:hypothetical protein
MKKGLCGVVAVAMTTESTTGNEVLQWSGICMLSARSLACLNSPSRSVTKAEISDDLAPSQQQQ